jgi:hypothetical protein
VATREDACPTLSGGIMINKWTTNASTTNWQPLRNRMLPYKVHYTNTHNGRRRWGTRSPTSNRISSSRTRTRTFCSRTSTFGHHIDRLCLHLARGKGIPHVSMSVFLFLLFYYFEFVLLIF